MLPRLCLILGFLIFGDSILPSGIRFVELSGSGNTGNSFEVLAGYRTGVRSETLSSGQLAAVVATFLKSTPSARAMAVAAYGAGGEIEFLSDVDRVGLRLKMPAWARPMVEDSVAEFLSETPQKYPALVDRAIEDVRSQMPSEPDVRSRAEDQFQRALLGPGTKLATEISRESVVDYFAKYYGTDRAFVVMNGTPANSLRSTARRNSTMTVIPAVNEETPLTSARIPPLHIQTDLDEGAALLGAPVPSVYYRNWYAFLMLDRLIQQTIPQKPATVLVPSLEPYFYRMEVAVPSGQTADSVEASLQRSLDQLQYVRASGEQLEVARRNALQYLESDSVVKWFMSLGVPERRVEGIEWVRSFSADDMRSTARDLVESNPVIVGWSPKQMALKLNVEALSDITAHAAVPVSRAPAPPPLDAVKLSPFPPHIDVAFAHEAPVRLESGVSIVASSRYAVFVAPNLLQIPDREPDSSMIQASYGAFRSSRILVLAPAESLERVKQAWTRFRGNVRDETATPITGNITSADVPALLVLKMLLDRRLIEAGLWNDTHLEIRASEGSTLSIHGSASGRKLVLDWMREIASRPIPDAELNWAREAALHRLPESQADMQSLIWEWNPDGIILDFGTIPGSQIQDVARIYLQ